MESQTPRPLVEPVARQFSLPFARGIHWSGWATGLAQVQGIVGLLSNWAQSLWGWAEILIHHSRPSGLFGATSALYERTCEYPKPLRECLCPSSQSPKVGQGGTPLQRSMLKKNSVFVV